MSVVEHGKSYINRLTVHLSKRLEQDENKDVPNEEDFDGDARIFTTASAGRSSDWKFTAIPSLVRA